MGNGITFISNFYKKMILNLFSKVKINDRLKNTSHKISSAISQIFTHKKLDNNFIQDLEDIMIESDMGSDVAIAITDKLKEKKFEKNISEELVKKFLAEEIEKILKPCEAKINLENQEKPWVVVFNGVNGVGKTTTIGKIADNLKKQNKKILIASCDTFRAGAVEQLKIWANRVGCQIIMPLKEGEDPASVAYRALDYATKNKFDIVLVDTAGRLHNKKNLMDELKKINNVIKKIDSSAPHYNLLIIDATTGQNAKSQTNIFNQIIGIDGLIITKLDGSAKGGIVVSLAKNFNKPIYAIGVGEAIEDLQEFDSKAFAKNLINL